MPQRMISLSPDLQQKLKAELNASALISRLLTDHYSDLQETEDLVIGLRKSYANLLAKMDERFATYDQSFSKLDKLLAVIEERTIM